MSNRRSGRGVNAAACPSRADRPPGCSSCTVSSSSERLAPGSAPIVALRPHPRFHASKRDATDRLVTAHRVRPRIAPADARNMARWRRTLADHAVSQNQILQLERELEVGAGAWPAISSLEGFVAA